MATQWPLIVTETTADTTGAESIVSIEGDATTLRICIHSLELHISPLEAEVLARLLTTYATTATAQTPSTPSLSYYNRIRAMLI